MRAFLFLFFWATVIFAQKPVLTNYTVDDGLPSNETYAIYEDQEGFIWIGTDRGVSRFNGYEFENFTTADGLPDNTIFQMLPDSKGRIWFRTFNGKMGFYFEGSFTTIPSLNFGGYVFNMAIDTSDRFYVVLDKRLLSFEFKSENWDTIHSKTYPRLSHKVIPENIEFWENSLEHFGEMTGASLLKMEPGYHIIFMSSILSLYDRHFEHLAHLEAPKMPVYTSLKDSVLSFYFQDKTIRRYSFPRLKQLGEDRMEFVLTSEWIDKQGNRWFSSLDQGIFFTPNPNCLVYHKGVNIDCIGSYQDDIVYADFEANLYQDLKKTSNTSTRIRDIRAYNGDLYRLHTDSRIYKNGIALEIEGIGPTQAFCFYKQQLWVANNRSLFRASFTGKKWELDTVYDKKYRVENLAINDQTVWMGTTNGLITFDMESETFTYDHSNELLHTRITDIAIHSGQPGTIFLATRGAGVLIGDSEKVYQISTGQGLSNKLTNAIFNESDSILWVATNSGLDKISMHSLNPPDYTIDHFTVTEGLSSNNINDVYVLNNTVYVATNKGLNRFPKNMTLPVNPLPVFITGIQINSRDTMVNPYYELTSTQNNIGIDFLGLSYPDAGNLTYQYRLYGKDNSWYQQAGTSLQFLSLPPDTYTFEIRAVNHLGHESARLATFSFRIKPPLYQTWWFILGSAIMIITLIYGIVLYRLKTVRSIEFNKRRLVEMELKALRSQMNPHFTFNTLNSIQSFINQRSPETAVDYMAKFAELIRSILENSAEEFIELNRELKTLERYLELESLRFENKFEYEIRVDESIDASCEKVPSMILQPYIENAIWPGLLNKPDKGKITVKIEPHPKGLVCIVEDNGIGRKKAMAIKEQNGSRRKSFGLLISQERLEILNRFSSKTMRVTITDLINENDQALGTRVELLVLQQ